MPVIDTLQLRRRVDFGRIGMVSTSVPLLALNSYGFLGSLSTVDIARPQTWLSQLGQALTIAFFGLVIATYLKRGAASATTSSWAARAAAVVATWLPLSVALVVTPTTWAPPLVVGDALLVIGTAWALWSLRTLGASISVFAQARVLVTSGPYALVRHPLYVGEICAALGIAVRCPGVPATAMWVALLVLQGYRALVEERVLAAALPGYAAYRAATARLVPGVF